MRNTLSCLSILLFGLTIKATIVPVDARSVHVPLGFDPNDETEVAVMVDLPDTCHRRPFGEVRHDGKNIIINIKADKVTPNAGIYCIQVLMPTLVSVPMGKLAEGSYQVVINENKGNKKWANLRVVSLESGGIDGYTYANVTNITKSWDGTTVLLEGYHPSGCMEIERVDLIVNETHDTIAILPIVKQAQEVCDQVIKPFTYAVDLRNLSAHETVLHIRKIDGRAINYMM
jgi:hypothetical protein